MLIIHLHSGHERTIDGFISEMERSGYRLAARHKHFTMPSSTLKFHRPSAVVTCEDWIAVAT